MSKPKYDGKVIRSIDEFERTYLPKYHAEKQERERMERMTPKQQAKYLGKKWADEIFAEIKKASA
jgi:hypothetical protein